MMSAQLQQQQQTNGAAQTSAEPVPAKPDPSLPLHNRAGESQSPYVRLHASTLVAWQPLDAATLELAKQTNKPIFMHIGFLADHHCRLTTQDSFSNPLVSSLLNTSFIPIIVDREERPDLDTIYQNYSEAVNATGGWPLNLFLTPDLYPIFGGTYWPGPGTEHSIAGLEGSEEDGYTDFLAIARKIHGFWVEQEERCRREAFEMLSKLQDFAQEGVLPGEEVEEAGDLDLDQIEEGLSRIAKMFDPVEYGFGTPKFPNPARLSFLLRLREFPTEIKDVVGEEEVEKAREMAVGTLRRVRDGGLRDHLGKGFMRFSVTRDWGVPHFEKMVGENALLLGVFLDAWLGQGGRKDDEFLDVVLELGDYLVGEGIKLEDGGFVSSEAADSYYRRGDQHAREGAYYLWTRREFDQVVGGDASDAHHASLVAAAHWNVKEDGNVPRGQDPYDEFLNQNVLYVVKDAQELSKQFGIPAAEVQRILDEAKAKLRAHREKERVRPDRDEKVLVATNGMVISALARTAAAIKPLDPERSAKYLSAAKDAVTFIKTHLLGAEQALGRFFFQTASSTRAFADDYAFLIEGLLDLYEVTLDNEHLTWASSLQETQITLFYDAPAPSTPPSARKSHSGGFYSTEGYTLSATILRLKSGMDKSQPSTNAVSASNLFRLGTLLSVPRYIHLAKGTINAFESEILQYPWLFVSLLTDVVAAKLGVTEVKVKKGEEQTYYTLPRGGARVLAVKTEDNTTEDAGAAPGSVKSQKVAEVQVGDGKAVDSAPGAALREPDAATQIEGQQVQAEPKVEESSAHDDSEKR
ncbi:hypothetical protein OQA88_5062 [Cercophora sp. LCS_1]